MANRIFRIFGELVIRKGGADRALEETKAKAEEATAAIDQTAKKADEASAALQREGQAAQAAARETAKVATSATSAGASLDGASASTEKASGAFGEFSKETRDGTNHVREFGRALNDRVRDITRLVGIVTGVTGIIATAIGVAASATRRAVEEQKRYNELLNNAANSAPLIEQSLQRQLRLSQDNLSVADRARVTAEDSFDQNKRRIESEVNLEELRAKRGQLSQRSDAKSQADFLQIDEQIRQIERLIALAAQLRDAQVRAGEDAQKKIDEALEEQRRLERQMAAERADALAKEVADRLEAEERLARQEEYRRINERNDRFALEDELDRRQRQRHEERLEQLRREAEEISLQSGLSSAGAGTTEGNIVELLERIAARTSPPVRET
jgi:hypothetical protein